MKVKKRKRKNSKTMVDGTNTTYYCILVIYYIKHLSEEMFMHPSTAVCLRFSMPSFLSVSLLRSWP